MPLLLQARLAELPRAMVVLSRARVARLHQALAELPRSHPELVVRPELVVLLPHWLVQALLLEPVVLRALQLEPVVIMR